MFRRLVALVGALVLGLALSACNLDSIGQDTPEFTPETSAPGTISFRFFARNADGTTVTPYPTGHVTASIIGNDGLEQPWRDSSDNFQDGPRIYDQTLPLEYVADWNSQSREGTVTVQVDPLPEGAYLECWILDENGEVPGSHTEADGSVDPLSPVDLTCRYFGNN